MADQATLGVVENRLAAAAAVETVCASRRSEEADDWDEDWQDEGTSELTLALETLDYLLRQGVDLTRAERMALREACRTQWFEDSVLQIIKRSKVPSEERLREENERQARRREFEDFARFEDDEQARADKPTMLSEPGRMRALGYEQRLDRARSKTPGEIERRLERKFVRRQRCCSSED